MTSLLMDCPQCGVMIPKGGSCEDCRWSPHQEDGNTQLSDAILREFARRRRTHTVNYAVFMFLMFATSLIGILTAVMWFRVIYFGGVIGFALIGFLTVVTAIFSGLSAISRKLFPVDLNCPACNVRVDEVGMVDDYCPNCNTQLK